MGKRAKRIRGIPLLPNLLTASNLLCGFFAILHTHHGRLAEAALFVLLAGFFDLMDGRVARIVGGSSGFGKEFDSLADLVSFGVAPAFLAYTWGLEGSRIGGLSAFLFCACGALRLARFNLRSAGDHFEGLPIPAAGFLLSTLYLFSKRTGLEDLGRPEVLLPVIFLLAFLMVSSIPYPSFKRWDPFRRRPFGTLVALVLMMVVLLSEPRITLFCLTIAYTALGPVGRVRRALGLRPEGSPK